MSGERVGGVVGPTWLGMDGGLLRSCRGRRFGEWSGLGRMGGQHRGEQRRRTRQGSGRRVGAASTAAWRERYRVARGRGRCLERRWDLGGGENSGSTGVGFGGGGDSDSDDVGVDDEGDGDGGSRRVGVGRER